MIAHYMPGLGNPLTDLDVLDFNRYSKRVTAIAKIASKTMSMRDAMLMGQGVF